MIIKPNKVLIAIIAIILMITTSLGTPNANATILDSVVPQPEASASDYYTITEVPNSSYKVIQSTKLPARPAITEPIDQSCGNCCTDYSDIPCSCSLKGKWAQGFDRDSNRPGWKCNACRAPGCP